MYLFFGAIGAIGVMFLVNPWACLGALSVVAAIYVWLRSRSLEQDWGDVSAGFWSNAARFALLKLNDRKIKRRNWRPILLCFIRDVSKRGMLLRLASAFGHNRGILTIAHMRLIGDDIRQESIFQEELEMSQRIQDIGVDAFCEVHIVEQFQQGIVDIAKGHGLGDLRTNTLIFGWSDNPDNIASQLETIRRLGEIGKSALLCRFTIPELPASGESIDIWWGGQEINGDLMILLAYLLKTNRGWDRAKIRILSVVDDPSKAESLRSDFKSILPRARVAADIEIISEQGDFTNILHKYSGDTDIVFVGLPRLNMSNLKSTATRINELSAGLRTTVFVQNNDKSGSVPHLLKL